MIEISIIIPVRNQKTQLLQTLNNLKRQIKKQRVFEIVICDDGSTDGTGDAVKKLRYPIFLKYYISNPPLGRALNRNFGFERSSGRDVIFLDGDMVPSDGYLDAMLGDGNSDAVRVGGIKMPPNYRPSKFEQYLYTRGRYDTLHHNHSLPGKMLASGNFMISRDNLKKLGGFDPGFSGWGGEDIDLGLRLEGSGIPIINVPNALTFHYHSKTIRSMAGDFYNYGKNTFAYLLKKHPSFVDQFPSHYLGLKGGSIGFFRIVSWLAVNKPVLKFAEYIVSSAADFPWPDFIYAYIIWGNLGLGYKNRENK